ncbi:E3 ubiquitin-protein ligase like [Capsicum chacoense]|uniref:E3 ubiquitin-protein ligase RNF217-like n=1 Tax=Capsicum annuum TaxID=4072 RepID=UPI001FB09FA5|nr:E3 ubiquitin-protein ligase RNF217-like [Capsicum annuum]KAF3659305.1 hypothetical protein FXO38_12771 [Capsicum annuum]
MGLRNIQASNRNEETDNVRMRSYVNENEEDIMEEDEDIQLQQILFYSAQLHSGKNLESSSNHATGKKAVEPHYSFIYKSIEKVNGIWEKGESSCLYCDICEDAFPPNTLIQGISCPHLYCEECIHKYIAKQINENIEEVKCPIANCKRTMSFELLLPYDVYHRVEDANREAKVLALSYAMDCPYIDCTGKLIDDKKRYLIRACPNCWRIFCVRCQHAWHWGLTCEAYRHMLGQINFNIWQSGGNVVEHQQEEVLKEETTCFQTSD